MYRMVELEAKRAARFDETAEPASCSQQPPRFPFSAVSGDSLLPDFVVARLLGGYG